MKHFKMDWVCLAIKSQIGNPAQQSKSAWAPIGFQSQSQFQMGDPDTDTQLQQIVFSVIIIKVYAQSFGR